MPPGPGTALERAAVAMRSFLEGLGSLVLPSSARELQGARATSSPPSLHGGVGAEVAEVLAAGAALALCLLALAVLATWLLAARSLHDPKAVFFAIFDDRIRGGFPSQSTETWSTVLTGVNSVLRSAPESPCVFLFLSGPRAEDSSLRLARALAAAVKAALRTWPPTSTAEDVEVQGGDFSSHEDYWHLYETLSRRLEEERVVVVRDLQAMHPRAAAAISHLCDDTYPPFPQSVLILLLSPGAAIYPQDAELASGCAVVLAEQCLPAEPPEPVQPPHDAPSEPPGLPGRNADRGGVHRGRVEQQVQ
ncbi:uncharacterized protein LOC113214315 [Frankliniella occidentalis]|uniref:Uncharacterized protein LOC113214315 n=1 Tax=Frankliniella occidentalis TaxID=133901 RepID=A0A9C6XVD2_FRAOC|nr:uncharacterized protein LOC113214315 [Frankliniella occidentalis]